MALACLETLPGGQLGLKPAFGGLAALHGSTAFVLLLARRGETFTAMLFKRGEASLGGLPAWLDNSSFMAGRKRR